MKSSVYVLPNTDASNESFAWLAKEISAAGGEATICESSFVGGTTNEAIVDLFQAARRKDYEALSNDLRAAAKSLGKRRPIDEAKRAATTSSLARFRRRLGDLAALNFFGAPGAEATRALVETLESRLRQDAQSQPPVPRATLGTSKGPSGKVPEPVVILAAGVAGLFLRRS